MPGIESLTHLVVTMVRRGATVLALAAGAVPAAAQRSLAPGTGVRITLRDLRDVEGRLLASDSASLTVRTGDSSVSIRREQIGTMSAASSTRSLRYGTRLGLATSAVGALFVGAVAGGLCEGANGCDNAAVGGGLVGAGLGFVAGGIGGAILGALFHDWKEVPASMLVKGRPTGATAPEPCASSREVGIQSSVGPSSLNGLSSRLGVTFLCGAGFSVGGELATLGNGTQWANNYSTQGSTSTNTIQSFDQYADLRGAFVEIPFHTPFNPRIIASAGYYRQIETTATNMYTYSSNATTYTRTSSTSRSAAAHPGAGLGLSLSMPLWQYLSLGADVRGHYIAGSGSMIRTLGLTVRIRP